MTFALARWRTGSWSIRRTAREKASARAADRAAGRCEPHIQLTYRTRPRRSCFSLVIRRFTPKAMFPPGSLMFLTPSGQALRVSVPRFGPPPACVSFRLSLDELLQPWQGELARRERTSAQGPCAARPQPLRLELVLLETDGTPWGCNVPLTTAWQDVRIPWDQLRHFDHWAGPADRGRPGDRFHPEKPRRSERLLRLLALSAGCRPPSRHRDRGHLDRPLQLERP